MMAASDTPVPVTLEGGRAETSPEDVTWLSLIRYQANLAVEQSRQPMPLAGLAINGFHDAIESILALSAGKLRLKPGKNPDFMELFGVISKAIPAVAGYRGRVDSLNRARVGFK